MRVACGACGESFDKAPCKVARSKRHYCSQECKHAAQRGVDHPNWSGGRVRLPDGYVYIHRPDHPNATMEGYVMEHRLVAEEEIGRLLESKEVVHHLNGVKDDNRPENLQVLPDQAAHVRLHRQVG